jgi:CRISPR/Cas system-associated exonuclease Cas4 (RecB family)
MYLSYSGYKTYLKCPRMYWYSYVAKPKLVVLENRVNTLYGTMVGRLFEVFYNEHIWNSKGVEQQLQDRVQEAYDRAVKKETRDGVIKWKPEDEKANYASQEALLADVRLAIPRGIRIIRHHRLLGRPSVAEVKLDHGIEGHILGGRADIIMRRIGPHHDLILLDGKGSKWRAKYVDDRQLKWYAMLHRLKHRHMPDRLGFVYWRQEPEKSVDWVDCSLNELDDLQAAVLRTIGEIEAGIRQVKADPSSLPHVFPACPGSECRFCPYFTVCPEGQKFASLTPPTHDGTGVDDVGL